MQIEMEDDFLIEDYHPIIPDTQYITIKRFDLTIGGYHEGIYRGVEIDKISQILSDFRAMKSANNEIMEFHIGAFEESYEISFLAGNPSPKPGSNIWFRFLFNINIGSNNRFVSPESHWFFYKHYETLTPTFVYDCINDLLYKEKFGKMILDNIESFKIKKRDDSNVRIDRRGIEMQMKYEKNDKIQI